VCRGLERGGAPPLIGRAARAPRPLHQPRRRLRRPIEEAAASSQARGPGHSCNSFPPPKQEPDDNEDEDYAAAMYHHVGLGDGSHGGY
jgi:hypothetical protein